MKRLTMMIGLPRSGKSTWVKKSKGEAAVIAADDFRQLIYGQRFYADGEGMVWATRDTCLKILLQQGIDIIIDETNTTAETRAKIIKLASKYGYEVFGIFMDTAASVCRDRAEASKQEDLLQVIDRMEFQFALPVMSEGFKNLVAIKSDGAYLLMD